MQTASEMNEARTFGNRKLPRADYSEWANDNARSQGHASGLGAPSLGRMLDKEAGRSLLRRLAARRKMDAGAVAPASIE